MKDSEKTYIEDLIKHTTDSISRGDVIKALRSIQSEGKSKSTVEVGRNVISGVCEYAIDEEHIKDNPCVGVIKRLIQAKKRPQGYYRFHPG